MTWTLDLDFGIGLWTRTYSNLDNFTISSVFIKDFDAMHGLMCDWFVTWISDVFSTVLSWIIMINIQIFFILNIIVTQIFCDPAPAADPDTFVVAKLPGCHSDIRYISSTFTSQRMSRLMRLVTLLLEKLELVLVIKQWIVNSLMLRCWMLQHNSLLIKSTFYNARWMLRFLLLWFWLHCQLSPSSHPLHSQ